MRPDEKHQIAALVHLYASLLDEGNLDGVAALFEHAELRSTRSNRVLRGAVEARTMYDPVIIYDDGTPSTVHQITNLQVEIDGDTATARSTFTVLQVTGQGLHPILSGEYRDRFARNEHGWHFTERVFDPKLIGDLSRHMRNAT
ncbi:MAG TPA: nuclear transport factor 2 family protein [Acidimicrobiia bacterium]|nr:nuclear transport factor 2 family protein [Acidimicrobiia bacterium]